MIDENAGGQYQTRVSHLFPKYVNFCQLLFLRARHHNPSSPQLTSRVRPQEKEKWSLKYPKFITTPAHATFCKKKFCSPFFLRRRLSTFICHHFSFCKKRILFWRVDLDRKSPCLKILWVQILWLWLASARLISFLLPQLRWPIFLFCAIFLGAHFILNPLIRYRIWHPPLFVRALLPQTLVLGRWKNRKERLFGACKTLQK